MPMTYRDLIEHMGKLQPQDMNKEVLFLSDEGYVNITFVWDLTSDNMFFAPAIPDEEKSPLTTTSGQPHPPRQEEQEEQEEQQSDDSRKQPLFTEPPPRRGR